MFVALAQPPLDLQSGAIPAWTFMVANLIVGTMAMVTAIVYAYRKRDPMPLYCYLGGVLAMFSTEPILDHNLLVWYPQNSPIVFAHLFDVPIPLWLLVGYPWYVGLGAFVVYRMIESGVTAKRLWSVFAVVAILDVIIEVPSSAAGVHVYYGNQPNFFEHGLSVSIPFVMSAVTLVCGFALRGVLRAIDGPLVPIAVIAMIPGASVAVLVGTQWPLILALNSNASAFGVWLSALVSIGLVLAVVHVGIATAAKNNPDSDSNWLGQRAPQARADA